MSVNCMNINDLKTFSAYLFDAEETQAMGMLADGEMPGWVDQSSEENILQGLQDARRGINSLIAAMEAEDVENI